MTPRISVILRVFNRARYVGDAIESILNQTFRDFELIAVVDDGSTDGCTEIVRKYAMADPRVRLCFMPHGGQAAANNVGLLHARGAYIACIDSDDIAMPERLELQLDYLQSTGADICGSQVETFGEKNERWWYPASHAAILDELTFRYALLPCTAMMRGDLARASPYVDGVEAEDYELFTRLALHCSMANLPDTLLRYRCHPEQVHITRREECMRDFIRYRFRYVYERFPETPLTEYLALALLAEGHSFKSAAGLETAGRWLLRFSRQPDRRLRERMARRWDEACQRSSELGPDVDPIRNRTAAELSKLIES